MMVLYSGVDVEEISRIRSVRHEVRQRFLRRILNIAEQDDMLTDQTITGIFCAKEAVSKALGCGIGPISWHEITILRDANSAPQVELSGRALERARELGIASWSISISHSRQFAVATAIGFGDK